MIKIKENSKDVNEFNYLYEEVGWGAYSYECSKKALDNTLYSISIYDEDKIIGFGRLIGDGICFIYIHDVMVVPNFQSQGIGSMIMSKLLEKVKEIKVENPSVRTYLGSSTGKEGFYEKFGFVKREEVGLGSGMILQNKDDFI